MKGKRRLAMGITLLAVAGMLALSLTGCGNSNALTGTLTLSGSTTVLPIAQEAADQFMKSSPGTTVTVQGGGSSVGITQVDQGVVEIGDSSRELKDDETKMGLVDHKVAYDVIVVVVNPSVKVDSLSADQVKGIFTGSVTNWSQVGGADGTITVVTRDSASGTREMFDEKALGSTKDNPVKLVAGAIEANSNGVMRQKVASTPKGIGYISYGYLDKSVKPLQYNGVKGNLQTALDKTYPLSRYLHMFTKGAATGLAKSYIDFVLSPDFQNSTVSKDYIPMTKVTQ
jgi:phosphate transport system substrate-binding protein